MIHIVLHFIVPLLVARVFCRSRWRKASVIMIATMLVDADHVLADPVYDPNRCSIGFHPLHTVPAIVIYAILFLLPLILKRKADAQSLHPAWRVVHLVGLGLLIHMALDWIDCMIWRGFDGYRETRENEEEVTLRKFVLKLCCIFSMSPKPENALCAKNEVLFTVVTLFTGMSNLKVQNTMKATVTKTSTLKSVRARFGIM